MLESFRPGVLDRLGVGYEAMREVNPAIVYCAITGYGQDGPLRDRSGHDMNYLGLVGLLGPDRRRRRAAGAGGRPDRRPRRRRADGRLRDPRRAARARPLGRGPARRRLDGRRRAVVAGDGRGALPGRGRRAAPRRPRARRLARLLSALRVRRRVGHARRAGAEVLAGVVPRRRARGPHRAAVRAPGQRGAPRGRGRSSPRARARSGARSPPSTTAAWSRCSTSTRRWTRSSCARARWWSSSTSRARSGRCACSACR